MKHLNLKAPLVPGQSAGGFVIGTHLALYAADIQQFVHTSKEGEDISTYLYSKFYIQYRWADNILVSFNLVSGQLTSIGVLSNYKGLLWNKIGIGMTIKRALELEPNLYYDEIEEGYYINDSSGTQLGLAIFLETEDNHIDFPENKINEITIFRHELMVIESY